MPRAAAGADFVRRRLCACVPCSGVPFRARHISKALAGAPCPAAGATCANCNALRSACTCGLRRQNRPPPVSCGEDQQRGRSGASPGQSMRHMAWDRSAPRVAGACSWQQGGRQRRGDGQGLLGRLAGGGRGAHTAQSGFSFEGAPGPLSGSRARGQTARGAHRRQPLGRPQPAAHRRARRVPRGMPRRQAQAHCRLPRRPPTRRQRRQSGGRR